MATRIVRNTPHPASAIERLSPAFALAPLGRKAPDVSGSGFGAARRTHVADLEVFVRDDIVFAYEIKGGFVCVVEALAADLAVQLRDLVDRSPVVGCPLVAPPRRLPEADLGHPFHWTCVDRWFDGEIPTAGIVEPRLIHVFRWSREPILASL